jgi:hypothetical protein
VQATPESSELLRQVQGRWEQIIARVAERSRGGAEVLREARPVRAEDNVVVLQFQSEFAYTQMQSEKRRQFVEQTISRLLGKAVTLRCEMKCAAKSQNPADNSEDAEQISAEQYAQEVAQTFIGYIEPEGG